MKKAEVPTSRYTVYCDLYDSKCEMKIHEVEGKQKLQMTMQNENLSLYREDVELMRAFLDQLTEYLNNRK